MVRPSAFAVLILTTSSKSRLFDRVGCWMFLALENVIGEDRRSTEHPAHACAVAQETTRLRQLSPWRYYGRPRRLCPLGDARLQREKHGRSGDDDSLAPGLHDRRQHAFQIVDAFDVPYLKLNAERSCGVLSLTGDATGCRIASARQERHTPKRWHGLFKQFQPSR
jgi:hypothetical protein